MMLSNSNPPPNIECDVISITSLKTTTLPCFDLLVYIPAFPYELTFTGIYISDWTNQALTVPTIT